MSSHHHDDNVSDRGIRFGLVLNSLYTVVEFGFGIATGSLALIADASHNLTDTFTLAVSYIANRVSRRDADQRRSFGYGRATILAALLNGGVMLAVACFISFEAIQRIRNPVGVEGGVIAAVAAIGIVVNASIAYMLSKSRQDINIRSAFINMAFDALSSLGAVVAGLIIMLTGMRYIDSVVGLVIAALLIYNTVRVVREAVQILLEGTPGDVDQAALTQGMLAVPGVLAVDDMHIWVIRSGYNALSAHITIDETQLMDSRRIVEAVKKALHAGFAIQHATIEVELKDCRAHAEHERH